MSKEIFDETLAVASDIENQLKFYMEMGLEDLGGSALSSDLAPKADSEGPASAIFFSASTAEPQMASQFPDNDFPEKKATQTKQVGLFGESIVSSKPGSPRGVRVLPVLDESDFSLDTIKDDIGDCRRCKLHEHRRTIVFGEGNPQARLVFVGEGPGAEEDASGRPFVGRAGQLLDKIIVAIGLTREDVYIANIVKCRPPGNRTPERDEVETCEPFLARQLAFIRPDVIVALGSPAFQCLLRTKEPISRARGQWREWNGIKVMPTFHPAFLLRTPDKKREVWEDMKKVRDYLNDRVS